MPVARIAKLRIREGSGEQFEAVFNELSSEMREKGPAAIYHILHRSKKDTTRYIIYEQYENEEAMIAHGRTRHFNMLGIKMGLFIVEPAEIEIVDAI